MSFPIIHIYCRVSTQDQSLETQLRILDKVAHELAPREIRHYTEKVSGQSLVRAEFDRMLLCVRKGDTILVTDIDRMARSLSRLAQCIEFLTEHGIVLIATKQGINTSTLTGRLMAGMIGAVAEFETGLRKERIISGIQTAKLSGKYKGRKPVSEAVLKEIKQKVDSGVSISKACKQGGISRSTYYKKC